MSLATKQLKRKNLCVLGELGGLPRMLIPYQAPSMFYLQEFVAR